MSYYAVAKGHNTGIFLSWNDCKEQVIGYKGAIHRKFSNEKEAEDFILNITSVNSTIYYNIYDKYDDIETNYYIYTDGSCINNGTKEAKAGIGIYFDINDERNVSRQVKLNKYDNITNNSAEILAIIEAFKIVEKELETKKICIATDSEYSIKCATFYGEKCASMNWKKHIPNRDLVIELYNIYKNNKNLKLMHIKAHTNKKDIHSIGNSEADKLAYKAIKL